ncbi:MAG: DNA-binding response regulator [Planctomycetota bacterium]|nr:MAG: DNA-binding response regulator [Planctomycetota bacterium]
MSAEPLTVVIADDEPLARATLRRLLERDHELILVGSAAHGQAAVDAVREHAPDLLLLDVQMPGLDGFGVLAALSPDELPAVVFVTAHDRYALDAFEVEAVDYLLKPFDDARFTQAIERAKLRARAGRASGASSREALRRLAVRHRGRIDLVPLDEVRWIESADQYVRLHCDDGVHLLRESMSHLEDTLDAARFLRVHRSAMVAVARLRSLELAPGGTGKLLLDDGSELPVARSRLAEVRARLSSDA